MPDLHQDERGIFSRRYWKDEFTQNGINFDGKQGNISENFKKHTLRGFHYQHTPSELSRMHTVLLYNSIPIGHRAKERL